MKYLDFYRKFHNFNSAEYIEKKERKEKKIRKIVFFTVLILVILLSVFLFEWNKYKDAQKKAKEEEVVVKEYRQIGFDAQNPSSTETPVIDKMKVLDDGEFVITASSENANEGIDVHVENKSGKDMKFWVEYCGANGITNQRYYDNEVLELSKGMSADTRINISEEFKAAYNITQVGYIDALLVIQKSVSGKLVYDEVVRFNTSAYEKDYTYDFDNKLYEDNNVEVYKKLVSDTEAHLILKSKSDKTFCFELREMKINGLDTYPSWQDAVMLPHTSSEIIIAYKQKFLQNNDIDTINTFEFHLKGYDLLRYNAEDVKVYETDSFKIQMSEGK